MLAEPSSSFPSLSSTLSTANLTPISSTHLPRSSPAVFPPTHLVFASNGLKFGDPTCFGPGSVLGLALEGASGYGCEERCDGQSRCPCVAADFSSLKLTRECWLSCQCGSECGSRIIQKVELLTTKEARIRQLKYDELASGGQFPSALLVVREHLPSGNACMRINIDATMIGNVARFINHSCDGGNLSTVLVRSSGALLPRLCFFASRDIQEDEELTFSYGEIRLRPNGLQCFCGSFSCLGILPSEYT